MEGHTICLAALLAVGIFIVVNWPAAVQQQRKHRAVRLLEQRPRKEVREVEPYVTHVYYNGNSNGTVSPVIVPVDLKHVFAVELVRAWIPRGEQMIHSGNSWLDLQVASNTYSIEIERGDGWTAQTAVSRIQALVRGLGDPALAQFSVAFTVRLSSLQFTNTSEFSFLFGSGTHASASIAIPLGFATTDVAATANGAGLFTLSGDRMDFAGARNMYITSEELKGQHAEGVLAQVPLSPLQPIVTYENNSNNDWATRHFVRPVHLQRLTLKFATFDQNRAARRAATEALIAARREQAHIAVTALDAQMTAEVDVQPPVLDASAPGWQDLDSNERIAHQKLREEEDLRIYVAENYADTQLDPYRSYEFNGLFYNLTLAVHAYRWKSPISTTFDERMD